MQDKGKNIAIDMTDRILESPYLIEAFEMINDDDPKSAIIRLKVGIKEEPFLKPWYNHALGRAYYDLGDFSLSLKHLDNAIKSGMLDDEERLYAKKLKGLSYFEAGDFKNAQSYFNDAIFLGDSASIINRGVTYYHQGRYSDAIDDLTHAIENNLFEDDEEKALVFFYKGMSNAMMKGPALYTVADLLVAVNNGGGPNIITSLGEAYFLLGEVQKGFNHLDNARKLLGEIEETEYTLFSLIRLERDAHIIIGRRSDQDSLEEKVLRDNLTKKKMIDNFMRTHQIPEIYQAYNKLEKRV